MTTAPGTAASDTKARIAAELEGSRQRSLDLLAPLDEPELLRQISPLMSPLVWDLAHIGNYEELWLLRATTGAAELRPGLDALYDAFEHPRATRPSLPILRPAEARAYLTEVRGRVLDVLEGSDLETAELTREGFVFGMVVQHEHMHDETMLATLQLRGRSRTLPVDAPLPPGRPVRPHDDVLVEGGEHTRGTSTDPYALDNERPAHRVRTPSFRIDRVPVSNRQYLAFVEAGGYDRPDHWDPRGWEHVQSSGRRRPMTWTPDGTLTRFGEVQPIDPDEPVQHVCFWEADAYARWAGRRLPTEQEWEKACGWDPVAQRLRRYPRGDQDPTPERANQAQRLRRYPWGDQDPTPELANLGGAAARPAQVGAYPAGASAYGVEQMVGDVWEWTSSGFEAWPGFRSFPYREYSEVFFGGDFRCLRGGSWATHPTAVRTTFRNWDVPVRRQIFSGFRTAADVS